MHAKPIQCQCGNPNCSARVQPSHYPEAKGQRIISSGCPSGQPPTPLWKVISAHGSYTVYQEPSLTERLWPTMVGGAMTGVVSLILRLVGLSSWWSVGTASIMGATTGLLLPKDHESDRKGWFHVATGTLTALLTAWAIDRVLFSSDN